MLASYDAENGFSGILSSISKMRESTAITDELKKSFESLDSEVLKSSKDILGLASHHGIAEKSAVSFMNGIHDGSIQLKEGQTVLQGYQAHLKSTSGALSLANIKTKALSASMKVLSTIGWMAAFAAASAIIGKAMGWIDDYVHRVERAKEALSDAKNNFESAKSELESINKELNTSKSRIDELNKFPSLTYVEQGELDKLKDITKELERQKYIKDLELKRSAEDLAESNRSVFNEEYGTNALSGNSNFSMEDVNSLVEQHKGLGIVRAVKSDIEGLAAAIIQARTLQEEARNSGDSEWLDNMLSVEDSYTKQLEDNLSTLQGYRDNLTKIMDYRSLTKDEQAFYDNLEQGIRLIYQFTDPNAWNQIEFDQIFNNESLEVTKEKLIELAQAGKLDENTIKQYSNLNDVIGQTDLILNDGETATQSFINQIKALASGSANTGDVINKSLSKQEVISNINSLSEGFESIDKIMKSISDKDNPFDYALLDDKKFKDNFDDLGKSYTDFIEKVSSSPKDVKATQSAFDNLVTTWIDSTGVLNGLTDNNAGLAAAMLQNMGVANAEEVVMSRLSAAQEHLAAQKAYTAEMSDTLANAMANEIPGLIEEATQSDIAKVALAGLALEKANANGIILDTSGDIENVISLIGVIGTATTALRAYKKIKAGEVFDSETQKSNREKLFSQTTGLGLINELDNQFKAYQEKVDNYKSASEKEVRDAIDASRNYKGKGTNVNASYDGVKANKPSGSKKSKEDTEKEIDWIERELKLLNDERSKLMDKASDSTIDYLGITNEEFSRASELFNSSLDPMSDGANELAGIAKRAGMSLSELYALIANGNPGESRENYLAQALELDKTILPQTEQAVESYKKIWEDAASKISAENKTKIELGYKDVDTLSGDELKNVETAMGAFDKYQSMQDSYAEAQKKNTSTIIAQYDNRMASINKENEQLEKSNSILEARIDYLKSMGEIPSASLYEKLIQNTGTKISNTKKEISDLKEKLKEARTKYGNNSEEYANLKGEISDAEISLYRLKKTQEEYNQALKQMPIDHLSTIISMYGDITAKIENWGAVYTATGKKLNAEYYQTLISNGTTVIGQYEKQIKEIKSLMSEYQKGSTVWQELYNQLQDIDSATSSMLTNLQKWNEELLKMPLDSINTYSDSLQKVITGLNGVKSELDSATSAITTAISDQINLLEEEQKAAVEAQQAEIDAMQEKADLLDKTNEKLKLQMSLEQAEYNLARSLSQKVNKEIRNGEEVYVEDYDAVRKAKEDKIDAQFNIDKYNLEQQIEDAKTALDDLNDGYQKQIEALEEISKKYSEISTAAEKISNANLANSLLGEGWADKVLSGNDKEIYTTLTSLYQTNAEQLEQYQKQADSTNNIYSLLEDYINSYKEGEITYEQAMTKINDLLSQLNNSMSAMDNLHNIFEYLGTVNGVGADADSILNGIKDGLAVTADELVKSLEQYNKNSGMISEYTSSWQQLTDNVKSMLDVLKQVRDNLRNALDDYDSDDDGDSDKTSSKGWGSDDAGNGPGVKLATSRKDGITRGQVGSTSDSDREASMKLLGLKQLDPDELTAVLHMGEAVFNEDQQNNLLKNLATAYSFKPYTKDYSNMLNGVSIKETTSKQEFKFGDINIQECNSANDLAKEILNGGLTRAVIQGLGKR